MSIQLLKESRNTDLNVKSEDEGRSSMVSEDSTYMSDTTCEFKEEDFISTVGKTVNDIAMDKCKFSWNWDCIPCFRIFENYFDWTQHFSDTHIRMVKKLIFRCDDCGDSFLKLDTLFHHYQTDHTHISIWCHKCGDRLKFLQSVSKHVCNNKAPSK